MASRASHDHAGGRGRVGDLAPLPLCRARQGRRARARSPCSVAAGLVRRRRRLSPPADPMPRDRARRRAGRGRHVRRQRQGASEPGLERPPPAVPRRPRRRPASRPTRSTPSCAPTCTSTTWAGTRCSSTGSWVPTFPNARYLLAGPSSSTGRRPTLPDGDDFFGDSVAPVRDAGSPTSSRSTTPRRGHPLRLDARAHAGSRLGRRRVRQESERSSPAT